jgi:hypothetical protein
VSRSTVLAAAALAFVCAGCSGKPPRDASLAREHVAKHFVIVVEEPDPLAPEEERAISRVTRPIASGPLVAATEHETAFEAKDPRFAVSIGWHGACFDVRVARHGLAPFDDFDAQGCVKPEGASTTVATVKGANGAPIQVMVWIFDGG